MSLRPFRLVLFTIAALLLTPSVASAAWTVTPTPNGPDQDEPIRKSTARRRTRASPSGISRTGGPVSVGSNSRALGRHELADGADPQSPRRNLQLAVRRLGCPRGQRLLRGRQLGLHALRPRAPLIELWNGTSWSIQPRPAEPAGSCSRPSPAPGSWPARLSGSRGPLPLARLPNAGTAPAGKCSPPRSLSGAATQRRWYGVSCPLRAHLHRRWFRRTPRPHFVSPLVERWFGRVNAWALPGRAEARRRRARLAGDDVSCPNGRVCVIVGSSGSSSRPLHSRPGPRRWPHAGIGLGS